MTDEEERKDERGGTNDEVESGEIMSVDLRQAEKTPVSPGGSVDRRDSSVFDSGFLIQS